MTIPRRPITPGIRTFANGVIAHINKYSDPFFQVSSWATYERSDDKPADLQIAVRILEHLPDPDVAIDELANLARKVVACMIELCDHRTADDWRKLLERHIRIARFDVGTKGIVVIGSPKVEVDGITIVGAIPLDDQWKQIEANLDRVKARIEHAPAHGRRAVLACYGPSLNDTIEPLRQLAGEAENDVITVSGAHDALLKHGIVPRYHVECDPRPHKADNIEKAHPGVVYLLASAIHPRVIDKLIAGGADIRFWHVAAADHTIRLVKEKGEPLGTVIGGGSSVGLRAIPLLYAMGYRDFAIFGMDSSFAADGAQWAGKHAGKLKDVKQVRCGDRIFLSSPVLISYATQFFELIQKVDDIKFELFGDGLQQEMARHYANGTLGNNA
jgi:hypothetical protein